MDKESVLKEKFVPMFLDRLTSGKIKTRAELLKSKRDICSELGIDRIPKNGEVLSLLSEEYINRFKSVLKSKPVRTASGVSVVALMTKPFDCPHGVCIFCPGGTRFNTPQSYTGEEPAARRAKFNNYDPYAQIQARLKHYKFLGYAPEKIETIIIGGTFTTLPKEYRDGFITRIYKALNDFPNVKNTESDLMTEEKKNETAGIRCVALAIETKPERCDDNDIRQLLRYGATRVEMGMQSVFDDVLFKNNRGHTIQDVRDSTARLRNNAYKVDHHIMINLPFSDIDKDRETIRQAYNDESLRPDAIKIYPTLVIKGTALYNMWEKGLYSTYPLEDTIDIVAEAEINAPKWLRIMRVERDIPSTMIQGGIRITNFRQLVFDRIKSLGKSPNDIRSREIGHIKITKSPIISLKRETYRAAGGDEVFLSIEDEANLGIIGFLRFRITDCSDVGLIRELHVYGIQAPISYEEKESFQHKGYGKSLLEEAESIARHEYNLKKIKIISGVGVREYYKKNGYHLENSYMVKDL